MLYILKEKNVTQKIPSLCNTCDIFHKDYDDTEELQHKVIVMLVPHVINHQCQPQAHNGVFHYKDFILLDHLSSNSQCEKN